MRVGKEIRQVLSITTPNIKYQIQPFFYPTTLSGAFKHTGMDYEITFQRGCRKHYDCQRNGIDENDSDINTNIQTTELADYEKGATCHPGGVCQCSDPTLFFGDGCTKTGKGTHAAAAAAAMPGTGTGTGNAATLPGDVPLLHCDTRGLYPGQTLDATVSVSLNP